ncbi:MAG: KpsF/GutQ family sugar-phosphate isomerase [Alphaproteobacteria bacterium GM7ARS4]|nr:KpsF/GutQ family sugar-phosphate isomerase [Alphaproteobacteria bacterium GM7ARS4]
MALLDDVRDTLITEAKALQDVAHTLDGDAVERALSVMGECAGRVIVTGVGKSGHIARKVAATLASTGTRAFFVHSAEACHGDLGMIGKGDVVLALSNSGKSHELMSIVSYSRRYTIPLIALCGASAQETMFCRAADVALLLPSVAEACPLDLAPTTSTTMMLALGDALALALLRWRGFSEDDFRDIHPGGGLGMRLQTVEALMHKGDTLPLVRMATSMGDALLVMTSKHFGCVGVVDDKGALCGVITDGDLRRHMRHRILEKEAGQIMTRHPHTIEKGALAVSALKAMNDASITSLFVTDGDSLVPCGILHIHDCLRAGIS